MKIQNTIKSIAACAVLTGTTASFAQHTHGNGQIHGTPTVNPPPVSAYAGQQSRSIKALSEAQTQDLLAGKGMELAKAAELNGYPGPMHTLELAQALALSPAQQLATQTLMERHKADARRLGAELVEAERALDQAFMTRQIDTASLKGHTQRIAELQAALRASHLQTHLQQTALLSPQQIKRYAELRGYTVGSAPVVKPLSHTH
ncbi:MAG: periplasmic heavy metal sensor [Polaromonas sp.]|nr:periplasmic heavy metal sensor [Polaromonas sp.]MDP3356338.1 periplasmic heavy metal sensor [Polaromonas sp.]MDP3752560.1 periplasmic heavy metal sensor [Polaromonas sp.]